MRKFNIIIAFLFISVCTFAQDISGQWNGVLKVQGIQLRIVFHIEKTATGLNTIMDSPDQGAKGIPTTGTSFENGILKITSTQMSLEYLGELAENGMEVKGDFKQGGQVFPMTLSRRMVEKEKLSRPQTPQAPYPYYSEDVTFENKIANISLAGTLTLPKKEGVYPVVILISGSGPQNRDEELFDHRPFLVLADELTKSGIAVLRYDDRGVDKSGGDFKTGTTQDFASDVESALAYLKTRKEINVKRIGLIGHSEGGLIAPMVAAKHKDISFIVLMAGPGMPISDLVLLQKEKIERQAGVPEAELKKSQEIFKGAYQKILAAKTNDEQLHADLDTYFKASFGANVSDKDVQAITAQITTPWWFSFLRIKPAQYLEKVKCPVLALNGERDLQVPAKENLSAIKTAFERSGNKQLNLLSLPKLNHLFQESETGAVSEYGKIEQTISPLVLKEIKDWIKTQVK